MAILQTPWAKNSVREKLVNWASEKGIELKIDTLTGRLPLEWRFQGVTLSKEGMPPLTFSELHIRLKLLPLLTGRICCSHLRAEQGQFLGVPFEARAQFHASEISYFSCEGEGFVFTGQATFDQLYLGSNFHLPQIKTATLKMNCSNLSILSSLFPLATEGNCIGTLELDEQQLTAEIKGENVKIEQIPFAPTTLTLHAQSHVDGWKGKLNAQGGPTEIPLSLNLDFHYLPEAFSIRVEEAHLTGPDTHVRAAFNCTPLLEQLQGSLSISCADLKSWRPLWKKSQLSGTLATELSLVDTVFSGKVDAKHFSCLGLYWDTLAVQTEFTGDRGEFQLTGAQGHFKELSLNQFYVNALIQNKEVDFALKTQGKWSDALELLSKGRFELRGKKCTGYFSEISGFAVKKAFNLKEPLQFEWSPSQFHFHPLHLEIGDGSLTASITCDETLTQIQAKATECPLDFFSLAFPHLQVQGIGNAQVDLQGEHGKLQGFCHLSVDRAEMTPYGRPNPLCAKGSLHLHLDQERAQVHLLVYSEQGQFIDFIGSFPIYYTPLPFTLSLDLKRPYSTKLLSEIELDDLIHFVNIGPQRLEGRLSADLLCSNSGLRGEVKLERGIYENYATGTILKDLSAQGIAQQNKISFHHLSAYDESQEGKLKGQGEVQLYPTFSFLLTGELDHFQAIADQMIVGSFSGPLSFSGDKTGSTIKGQLQLVEAHFTIPDRLPSEIPSLNVHFIHPPDILMDPHALEVAPLLTFDLDLIAPRQIFVEGRGFNCELKGQLHLSGSYASIAAHGNLSLVKGEYLMCGKVFNLNQAELIFKDKPTPSASVILIGTCDLIDVTATVAIRGPLSSPTLTLQSIPQLSTSALLARILFNKDISQISPLQALQLAQTLLSISGNSGPSDLFDKVRKLLHIDRLTLLTSENDPGKVSLQIGKYLTRGILLTLVQGATSRNVAVEVEILRGFTFQAEMNEKQQGKFSLKWHHHY